MSADHDGRRVEGVGVHHYRNYRVIKVDTRKAWFKGQRVCEMGDFRRKKLDNFLYINPPRCPSYCSRCLEFEQPIILYT
jgi:hypothetical protein